MKKKKKKKKKKKAKRQMKRNERLHTCETPVVVLTGGSAHFAPPSVTIGVSVFRRVEGNAAS